MLYPELFDKRVQMLDNVMNHVENEYVPTVSLAQTWAMSYAGETASTTMTSQKKEFEVYSKYLIDLGFDMTLLFAMNRPLEVYDKLGYSPFFFSADDITLQNQDACLIPDEELDEFIADPITFMRNKMMYRRYPAFREEPMKSVVLSMVRMMKFNMKNQSMNKYLRKNVGVPTLVAGDLYEPALDRYVGWRSFAKGMTDMRRRPEKVLEALDAIYDQVTLPMPGEKKPFPLAFAPVTSATYLNQKQFEKFFWPHFKKLADTVIADGGRFACALEGTWGPQKYEMFKEFPKGKMLLFLEGDDIVEVHKVLGDHCALSGGMDAELLRSGTPQQNIDKAKEVLDACGTTGILLSPGKCLLSPNDAKAENMKAVNDFVHEYTRK